MYQFYSASIVGSLLAPPPKFINNLIDLADSELHVASEDIPYSHDYFKVSSFDFKRFLALKFTHRCTLFCRLTLEFSDLYD